jgi:hypothetical protein
MGKRQPFGPGCCAGRLRQLCQAEVENLRPSVPRDEKVFRLEIAVDNPFFVCRRQPRRHLHRIVASLARRHRTLLQHVAQALTFQKLRNEVGTAILGADVIEPQNVWMVQCRYCPRFLLEPPQPLRISRERLRQNLDRHIAAQPSVAGAVDLTHSARSNQRHDFVRPQLRARVQGHKVRGLYLQGRMLRVNPAILI